MELAERIERHELDAGRRVDLLPRDVSKTLVGTISPLVAVLVGNAKERLATLHQHIIDPPGIGAERADWKVAGPGLPQSLDNLGVEMKKIPAARTVDHHRLVGKTMQFLKRQAAVP